MTRAPFVTVAFGAKPGIEHLINLHHFEAMTPKFFDVFVIVRKFFDNNFWQNDTPSSRNYTARFDVI